jgi:hypothetical protein
VCQESLKIVKQEFDLLRQSFYPFSGYVEGVIDNCNVLRSWLCLRLFLLHKNIKELVVLVSLGDIILLLAHYPCSEFTIASGGPLLEAMKVTIGESGENVLEQELFGESDGLNICNG